MVQIIEQSDFGEDLGKALGGGFSKGASQLMDFKLKEMLQAQKFKQQEKEQERKRQEQQNKPFSVFEIMSNLGKLGVSKDQLGLLEPNDFMEIMETANRNIGEKGRDMAFVEALQEKFNPQTYGSDMPAGLQSLQNKEMKEESGLWDVLQKGLESSISGRLGSIAAGEGEKSFQERTRLPEGAGWFKSLLHNLAKFGGDLPYYAAGGTAGAAAGGALGAPAGPFGAGAGALIGGGAGALSLPALIETGLQEYQKYTDRGGKGTFGDFIDSAAKTLEAGTYGAAEGALLGPLSRLKVLSKVPGGKKLLKMKGGKAVEKVLDTGAQAGIFTTSKGVAEQRIPSIEEYGADLGMFLGLDLMHNAGKYSKNVYNSLKKAQIPPQEAAVKIQEKVQEKGYDLTKPNDVVRVVKDITAEKTKAGEVAQEKIRETVKPEESPKETAKKLADRPIEEYIEKEKESQRRKERPITEREKAKREAAAKEIPVTDKKIEKIQDDVSFLRERLESKLPKDQRPLAEIALKQKEKELADLQKHREDLKGISEKGKKPFREEDLIKPIEEHMDKLKRAAEAPESPEAQDLKRMFDRDQKYIDRFFDLAEKGDIPEAKFKDRYVKILETYADAYKDSLKRAEQAYRDDAIARSELGAQKSKERAVLDKYLDLLKKNMRINESKIKTHKDKVNSLQQLKRPLVKQHLKEMRKDIKDLQKDFIKQTKIEEALQKKLDNVLKETVFKEKQDFKDAKLKNADKVAEKLSEDVSPKIDKAAEKADISKGKFKKAMDKLIPEVQEIIKTFKEDPSKGINKARQMYRLMPFMYQVAAGSLLSAALAELGVPYYIRFWFIPSNSIIRGLGTGIGSVIRNKYHDMVIDSYVQKLANERRKSIGAASQYMNSLEDKLKPKDRKEILKRYREASRGSK